MQKSVLFISSDQISAETDATQTIVNRVGAVVSLPG